MADNRKVSVRVFGGEVFSGFYKEERTDGQTDGRFSHSPMLLFLYLDLFKKALF